jgi:hypothetical protein
MEKRRQFLKRIFGFVVGASISLTPAFSLLKAALAKSTRTILAKRRSWGLEMKVTP